MNTKIYGCYEKDFAGKWCLTVYHDGPPHKMIEREPARTKPFLVQEECIINGIVDMNKVKELNPEPVEEANVSE